VLPVFKGHLHSKEDLILRAHIKNLMCSFETSWIGKEEECDALFESLKRLSEMKADGLVNIFPNRLVVTEKGKPFVRNISMAFDARLWRSQPQSQIFSQIFFMNPTQNLYYALGHLAFAIAKADGHIQKEEKQKLHDIILNHSNPGDFGYSEIIFRILEKDHLDIDTTYNWALNEIELCKHYFDPGIRNDFFYVLEKVAEAFPPVSKQERNLLEKLRNDLQNL